MSFLQSGELAPVFQTEDLFGHPIDLRSYAGSMVLLSFFRNAACALCNLRVHHLIERYPAYASAGLAILVVFESPREHMLMYVGRQDAPFPLIPDPQARLYNLYEVESSATKLARTMELPQTEAVIAEAAARGFPLTPEPGSNFERMPADFLIGPDGRLLEAHYADHATDHLPLERIADHLRVPAASPAPTLWHTS